MALGGAGRVGDCLDHLEEAARRRHNFVAFARRDTLWDPVRHSERFAAFLRWIG